MTDRILLPWEQDTPPSLAERIAAQTAKGIVEARYEAGDLLTEVALAEELSASRTPAREAMLRLQGWGLVRLLPKKGAIVTPVTVAERRDLLSIRRDWEHGALAAIAGDEEAMTALAHDLCDILAVQQTALESEDILSFAAQDVAFHLRTIASGGNGVIAEMLALLGPRFARLTYSASLTGTVSLAAFRAEHEELLRLVEAGDTQGFDAALERHLASERFPADR